MRNVTQNMHCKLHLKSVHELEIEKWHYGSGGINWSLMVRSSLRCLWMWLSTLEIKVAWLIEKYKGQAGTNKKKPLSKNGSNQLLITVVFHCSVLTDRETKTFFSLHPQVKNVFNPEHWDVGFEAWQEPSATLRNQNTTTDRRAFYNSLSGFLWPFGLIILGSIIFKRHPEGS